MAFLHVGGELSRLENASMAIILFLLLTILGVGREACWVLRSMVCTVRGRRGGGCSDGGNSGMQLDSRSS